MLRVRIWRLIARVERTKAPRADGDCRRAIFGRIEFAVPHYGVSRGIGDGAPFVVADLARLARRSLQADDGCRDAGGQYQFANADFHGRQFRRPASKSNVRSRASLPAEATQSSGIGSWIASVVLLLAMTGPSSPSWQCSHFVLECATLEYRADTNALSTVRDGLNA